MQGAIIAALNTKAFPNPKVAAVLTDNKGNIKSTGVHHGPGTNHAEIDLTLTWPNTGMVWASIFFLMKSLQASAKMPIG